MFYTPCYVQYGLKSKINQMKVKVIEDELYKVTVSRTIEVDIPKGTKDIKAYLEEYIKGEDAEEVFLQSDNREEVYSDVQETYYQMKTEDGEYTTLNQIQR